MPVVHEVVVSERDDMGDGRRGLHLVSRTGEPASVLPVPDPIEPAFEVGLPVLTSEIHGPPVPAAATVEPGYRLRLPPPTVALALAALVLVAVAASLRWHASSPAASPPPMATAAAAARPVAAVDRPFANPEPGNEPDAMRLSFPALEVAPGTPAAGRPEPAVAHGKAGASARPPGRAREGRVASDSAARSRAAAPEPCTSNLAALGFCTLEPPSAKD